MLHSSDPAVRRLLLEGRFGLEKESLRVTGGGFLAQTPHPFPDHPNIVMDFSENQLEINTDAKDTAEEVLRELEDYTERIRKALLAKPEPEYLWPFSNPPYIRGEEDIPVAQYYGKNAYKTGYRKYLSEKYGRYKMTFSGIHVNYSLSEELLKADFTLCPDTDFRAYKDRLYLELVVRLLDLGWMISVLLAASPVLDESFFERGKTGGSVFAGNASMRLGDSGYWNDFVPVLSYGSVSEYVSGIQRYIDEGILASQTELYYPVRLKSRGENSLEMLLNEGADHIEIRNVDLNPFAPAGIEAADLKFIQLLIVYAAMTSPEPGRCSPAGQIEMIRNFKEAARYDIDIAKIKMADGTTKSVRAAALEILKEMQGAFDCEEVQGVLAYQEKKLTEPGQRYAEMVRRQFSGEYTQRGMEYIKTRQRAGS